MLKIITDRSDNGNKFLCLNCRRAATRSGTMTEMEVYCNSSSFPHGCSPVNFPVTQCSEYEPAEIQPKGNTLQKLENEAYYVVNSHEGRGIVLVDPAEFKRRMASGETSW